ncbi:MAG: U32 family peptidase, partial [Clostridiales bacterium]|nr:U32 family peptidase [Clostridiales bacterium]
GIVTAFDKETGIATVEQRNRMFEGETIEVVAPEGPYFHHTIRNMKNIDGEDINVAPHPQMTVFMPFDREVGPFTMLRRKA